MSAFVTFLCIGFGVLFALSATGALVALAVGSFDEGRGAAMAMAALSSAAAAALLVLPFHRRLGRVLGGIALVLFAAVMVVAVFSPGLAAATPGLYQVAAIALVVLVLARLGLAMRRPRRPEES